jgi:hypothetical protein
MTQARKKNLIQIKYMKEKRFSFLLETCHQPENDDYHHLYLLYVNTQEGTIRNEHRIFFSLSSYDDAHRPSHVFICVPQADEMK